MGGGGGYGIHLVLIKGTYEKMVNNHVGVDVPQTSLQVRSTLFLVQMRKV